jgi:hypothetical protein
MLKSGLDLQFCQNLLFLEIVSTWFAIKDLLLIDCGQFKGKFNVLNNFFSTLYVNLYVQVLV